MKRLLLLLFATLWICCAAAEDEPAILQVHQIAVGQADAYLILCGDIAVMIDGGNAARQTPEPLLDYLRRSGLDHLDACILTHYHADHAGNIQLLLEEFGQKDTVVFGPSQTLPKLYSPLPRGQYQSVLDGDAFSIGPLDFLCVGPAAVTADGMINEDSLNVLMTYGKRSFLFTGDYADSDNLLRNHASEVAGIDVLKFPHHGMRPFALSVHALAVLRPSVVLVPGFNRWGVEDWLKANHQTAAVYDMSLGHVVLTSDGDNLEVTPDAWPGQFALR